MLLENPFVLFRISKVQMNDYKQDEKITMLFEAIEKN